MGAIVDAYAVRLARIELSKYVRQSNYDRCKSYPAHLKLHTVPEVATAPGAQYAEASGEVWASSRRIEWSREHVKRLKLIPWYRVRYRLSRSALEQKEKSKRLYNSGTMPIPITKDGNWDFETHEFIMNRIRRGY